jgi:hypothetical protein
MKSLIFISVVICLGCSISGCGGYGPPNNSQTPSLAGAWQFNLCLVQEWFSARFRDRDVDPN